MVDCIYIAAAGHDATFTRTCVASIRRLYPYLPIRLLAGEPLQQGLANELQRYWAVQPADITEGEYGWGFVKLEPLFKQPGERFLVLDSDTVITGPVLTWAEEHDDDFIVDDEVLPAERAQRIYYDHFKAGRDGGPAAPPAFLFNTGQWFGRSGLLNRDHFRDQIEWLWPRKLLRQEVFKNGDQGIFNFVLNEQFRLGNIRVRRVPLMRWPGNGMQGLDAASVSRATCPSLVIHWAGMSRKPASSLPGADVLSYFKTQYCAGLPLAIAANGPSGSEPLGPGQFQQRQHHMSRTSSKAGHA